MNIDTTKLVIWTLSILDAVLLGVLPFLDKSLYGIITKPIPQHFFCNPVYDDAINRFVLSKGGLTIMGVLIALHSLAKLLVV